MIDPELRHIIEPELTNGETVLWTGRPDRHTNFGLALRNVVFCFIFMAVLLMIALRLQILIYANIGMGAAMPLRGTIFIILTTVLVAALIGFFIYQIVRAGRQMRRPTQHIYVLSDKRAFILNPTNGLDRRVINNPVVIETKKSDESYSLRLGDENSLNIQSYRKTIWREPPPVFFHLTDGLDVKKLIETTFPKQEQSS